MTDCRKFGWSTALLMAANVLAASGAAAQGISARMIFPPRNYELALGDTITPVLRVWNRDTVASAPVELHFRIRNVVTGLTVYDDSVFVPSIGTGDSLGVGLAPYASSPSALRELGTFSACVFIGSDSLSAVCTRFFGIRRTAVPFLDPSNNYSKSSLADIPDQTLWVSLGATVVDGEDSTWDPPPPRGGPYGPDSLMSPVIRLDRKDEAGNYYSGTEVGDTLTSFPINLQNKIKMTFKFDFMRAGRHHYPFGWDTAEMFGPESTILDSAGNVLHPGDSLILEFKNPKDSELNPPAAGWNEMAAIDGGHDFEFKSFFAKPVAGGWQIRIDKDTSFVPDTNNYFTADFRFRLRLKASNNGSQSGLPKDDADGWYIDNPTIEIPIEPELEVRWVRVVNPYTKIPQSQAIFPIYVDIQDHSSGEFVALPFRVTILDPQSRIVYSQEIESGVMQGQDSVLRFPDWDATSLAGNNAEYTITAAIAQQGVDTYTADDTTSSKFYLNIDQGPDAIQEFAYDHAGLDAPADSGNDIPNYTRLTDAGIGFTTSTTGSFAMKFQLVRKDTVYGVRAYSVTGYADDAVRISILTGDSNSCVPGGAVLSAMEAAFEDFDAFGYYDLPNPLVLPPGTYWASISQLGLGKTELGGDLSRGGGLLASAGANFPRIHPIYNSQYGTQWGSDPKDNNGSVGCSFAVETPAGSGNWQPMMPDSGWWPAMVPSSGLLWQTIPNSATTGFGTYLPMIRVIIGNTIPAGVNSEIPASSDFALRPCSPNPFDPNSGALAIDFSLPAEEEATVIIYNALGTEVRTITEGHISAGDHHFAWNGRDESGAIVPPGIYVVALTTPEGEQVSKLVVTP